MIFRFLPPAATEIKEAAKYYEGKVPGLGFEFIAEVRAAIRRILEHPQAWCPLDDSFRRCRTSQILRGSFHPIRLMAQQTLHQISRSE
jgi:hypothetical protein